MKEGDVFRSQDEIGDLHGELMFVSKILGEYVHVMFGDGNCDVYKLSELNVNPDSVRKYDPDLDKTDFYGLSL